ncbi:MaoC family dehydratase N-terminal domain-containing protein [Streptomyces sp. NPDC052052]|uniref:FAS1-like dehydratase domain-containing protein n=1 Tax=Streptomyces sp. NPDC052052 TaxID=3154756 RepID=UPI003417B902
MSETGLISDEMRKIVGRPYGRLVSYPVSASDIRKWARAVYFPQQPPARYTDPAAEHEGLVAPLDFNPFAWGPAAAATDEDAVEPDPALRSTGAMEHRLGVVPPDLRRALNGGLSVAYTGVPMRPGDVITAESAVAGYTEKHGRLGPMLLTDVTTSWTNQCDALVKTHRMTLIRY